MFLSLVSSILCHYRAFQCQSSQCHFRTKSASSKAQDFFLFFPAFFSFPSKPYSYHPNSKHHSFHNPIILTTWPIYSLENSLLNLPLHTLHILFRPDILHILMYHNYVFVVKVLHFYCIPIHFCSLFMSLTYHGRAWLSWRYSQHMLRPLSLAISSTLWIIS